MGVGGEKMIQVNREILSLSNPSFRNIPDTTVEDTARRRRRGLSASARRKLARRQAARISAALRTKRTRRFRQQTRKSPDVTTTVTENKQVGTVFRASVGGSGPAVRVPIIKRVTTKSTRIGPIRTRRQIRQARLSRRLLVRRAGRRRRSRRR